MATLSPPASGELASMLRKPFYSPSEVAEVAGLSSSTILHYIHDGKLPAVRLSERTYRIPRKAILRLFEPDGAVPPRVVRRPDRRGE